MIAEIDKKPISIDQFLDWYPESSQNGYELRRGVVVEMPKPRGKHSEIAGFLIGWNLTLEYGISAATVAQVRLDLICI